MFHSLPTTAYPSLGTPSISSIVQNQSQYQINLNFGTIDSRYQVNYTVYEDGISIYTNKLVDFTNGKQTFSGNSINCGTYAQGKTITVGLSAVNASSISAGVVTTTPVFSGSFTGVDFTYSSPNAYTDPTEGTKYSWTVAFKMQPTQGYYNESVQLLWEWNNNGSGTYPNAQTFNVSPWPAAYSIPADLAMLFASTGAEGGAYSKLSPHNLSGGNYFRLTVTISAAGYSTSHVYPQFSNT